MEPRTKSMQREFHRNLKKKNVYILGYWKEHEKKVKHLNKIICRSEIQVKDDRPQLESHK